MNTQTALVTGASGGIGRAIALNLAEKGFRLGLTGRDQTRLEDVATRCSAMNNGQCVYRAFDLRNGGAFMQFLEQLGPIDLYVSNAGVLDGRRDGETIESKQAALRVLEVNLVASVDCLHSVLGGMRPRRKGQIVLVSSLAGLSPLADAPAYSASKAGLISYGLAMRESLRNEGIGITVACPGYINTPMATEHRGYRPQQMSDTDAAARILAAAFRNKALCGFPFPLYPAAHLSIMTPPWLNRLFTKGLRFTVVDR